VGKCEREADSENVNETMVYLTQTSLLYFDKDGRPRHRTVAECGVSKDTDGVRSVGDEVADGGELAVVDGQHEPT